MPTLIYPRMSVDNLLAGSRLKPFNEIGHYSQGKIVSKAENIARARSKTASYLLDIMNTISEIFGEGFCCSIVSAYQDLQK